ncbi:hypothetical protein I4U23_020186 [Adineta vaga]|nr:hypothetical protein I4U23_020186 [Adineta vaga]
MSPFQFETEKLREKQLEYEYNLTGIILHWKRLHGVRKTISYFLQTDLFHEIIVWNNNPQINLTILKLDIKNYSTENIRIINSKDNLKDEAKYRTCIAAKTRACFYVDDDWDISHYTKSLIASYRSDPNLLHSITEPFTYYTNLLWSYFDDTIDLHTGFSWIGCGSVFSREHAQRHLQFLDKCLSNNSHFFQLSDVFFSIWLNDIPTQMITNIRYQTNPAAEKSVAFSSIPNFPTLQYQSSLAAIRILEHFLRSNQSDTSQINFPRQQIRRFPYYIKSPSLTDDFIFYSNILPYDLHKVTFNITRDFERGTTLNLPKGSHVRYFTSHSPLKAVDRNLKTCWHSTRMLRSDDFYAIDFLHIQTNISFLLYVNHSLELQKNLVISISFDGLWWISYRSQNGIYTKTSKDTGQVQLHMILFSSDRFNPGFQSFRYIKFQTLNQSHDRFQVKPNSTVCSLRGDQWIVLTTINYPTPTIYKLLQLTSEWHLIVVAQQQTPINWLSHINGNQSRIWFLSLNEQYSMDYSILQHLPDNSHARKNIGYLVAIQCGAKIIYECEDNVLLDRNDIYVLPKRVQPKHVPWISFHRERSPFVNIYGSFGQSSVWPRGFPVSELRNITEDGWHSVIRNDENNTYAYIQQCLIDGNPDVDALYRLAYPLAIDQIRFDRNQPSIVLQPYTFSPYNIQNTITYYEAFWGLILPVTTTFRVSDIWRSFWVQRLLWDIGGRLLFGTATLDKINSSNSYIKDMDEENQLYHQSGSFVRFLVSWSSTLPTLIERILRLSKDISQAGFWKSEEINVIKAWINDLQLIGYSFPTIIGPSSISNSVVEKRAAVCVTGLAECVQEAWTKNHHHIRNSLQGDMDIFLFLSSSMDIEPNLRIDRIKQARTYLNTTVTVLYEDRDVNPNIPSDCEPNFIVPTSTYKVAPYYQQLWALAECYKLVKNFEKRFHIKYQLMIRTRVDIVAKEQFTLESSHSIDINTTLLVPPNRFFIILDDGFAAGPMELMHHYMTRLYSFKECPSDRIYHSELYLARYLKRFTNVTYDKTLPTAADALPHGPTNCH